MCRWVPYHRIILIRGRQDGQSQKEIRDALKRESGTPCLGMQEALEKADKWALLQSLQKECSIADTVILVLNTHLKLLTSEFYKNCFKPPNLWQFVTAARRK